VILYVNGCAHLLDVLAGLGPAVVSIDWRVDPREARRRLAGRTAVQGNLDPTALFAPPETVRRLTAEVLEAFGPEPGHIFNLGSGILPTTPVESMEALVGAVRGEGPA
jgi:uroporphyrinogen decarboxylase